MALRIPHLLLYSAPGCCLCGELKEQIHSLEAEFSFTMQEVDISTDADLERLYRPEIPVLFIDGRKVAKYRASTEQLRRALAASLKS